MLVSLQRLVNGDGLTEDTVAGRASVFWSGWHDELSNSTIIECVRCQALVKFAIVDQHQGAIVENKLAPRIANRQHQIRTNRAIVYIFCPGPAWLTVIEKRWSFPTPSNDLISRMVESAPSKPAPDR